MKPAILYARFSPRPSEAADSCESIAVQMNRNVAYCKTNGLTPKYFLTDRLQSARTTPLFKRPAGKLLQKLLRNKKANDIVCQKLDRIFRNQIDGLTVLDEWNLQKVSLHLADQGGCTINCATATGRMLAGVLLNFAEFEPAMIAERTSGGMRHRQSNGQRMSRFAPYGWQIDKTNERMMILNKGEQRNIRIIKSLHERGLGNRQIATELEALSIMPRGKQWNHSTVSRILRRCTENL